MVDEGQPRTPPARSTGVGDLGLGELATILADGRLTSRDVVEDVLARIEASVCLPLLGVPIAVKDDTDIAGEPTAIGCGGEFPLKVSKPNCSGIATAHSPGGDRRPSPQGQQEHARYNPDTTPPHGTATLLKKRPRRPPPRCFTAERCSDRGRKIP